MRTLLLLRGAPGCGKSTYIKEHNLEQYVLSADTLRLMCQSSQETPAGRMEISPQNDDVVWEMLFKLLEVRMSHGEFTVIDATNSKTVEMNRYKNLAKQYRYRMYVIDMTDLPIEECKRRNAQREWLKRVPEAAIDKMYARFATQKVPSGVTVLPSTTDVMSDLNYSPNDFNQWKKINIIGDIHGCYTCLSEYLGEMKDDELYMWLQRIIGSIVLVTPLWCMTKIRTLCIIYSVNASEIKATAICLLIIMSTVRCAITLMVRLFQSRRC